MRQQRLTTIGLAVFGLLAAVTSAGSVTVGELQGSWRLVEIQSQPVRPAAATALPGFTIADQSIEGFDGCNSFSGRLDRPDSIVSTRRGCPDGGVKIPLDLADPMSHLQAGRIDKGRLILPARREFPDSVFERAE